MIMIIHDHCTNSQCDRNENCSSDECDSDHSSIFLFVIIIVVVTCFVNLYFSQCKDRVYFVSLQTFS